jgi:hypothetical protein
MRMLTSWYALRLNIANSISSIEVSSYLRALDGCYRWPAANNRSLS